jgi:hypothetical protein
MDFTERPGQGIREDGVGMNLLKTCAAVLSLVLVLQTGCDLWCHHAESDSVSVQQTAGPPAPACHGTTDRSEGSEKVPTRDDESSKGCVHPQAADDNSKLQTKVVNASHQVISGGFAGIQVDVLHTEPYRTASRGLVKASPPSSLILRI